MCIQVWVWGAGLPLTSILSHKTSWESIVENTEVQVQNLVSWEMDQAWKMKIEKKIYLEYVYAT